MNRRIVSKFFAAFILLFFAFTYVLFNPATVNAVTSISFSSGSAWGERGQANYNYSNAQVGDVIVVRVTVDGTLTRCYDNQDHEGTVSGNTAICTLTITEGNKNSGYYAVYFVGEDMYNVSNAGISVTGNTSSTPSPSVQQTNPPPLQPSQTTPAPSQTTPAPAQTDPEAPAPVQTEPAAPVQTENPVQPAPDVPAPAPDVPAAPAADQPQVPQADPVAPAPEQPAAADAAPAAEVPATEAAAVATEAPQDVNSNNNDNNNNNNVNNVQTESGEEDTDDQDVTETTEQTTVPIVIMDAQGNLITVTPTPTPFPLMSGTAMKYSDDFGFPLKPVLIGLAVIGLLGARYFILKSRGLRGGSLLLEFVPGVSDIADRLSRRGTKISESSQSDRNDYSNSTSARAAEAAREAQQARAEFARAARERAELKNSGSTENE